MLSYDDLIIGKQYKLTYAYYTEKVITGNSMYYRRGRSHSYPIGKFISKRLYDDGRMRLVIEWDENSWKEFILPKTKKNATGVIDISELEI